MTILIAAVLLAGGVLGYFAGDILNDGTLDLLVDIVLYTMVFCVGVGLGRNELLAYKLKRINKRILLQPVATVIGSVLGGALGGLAFGLLFGEGAAVGAGLGWYSLSAVIISSYSNSLATVALLTNVWREVLAFVSIPLVSKKLGSEYSISLAGATAMDTALPLVRDNADPQYRDEIVVVSFLCGCLLSAAVPLLVPLFL